MVVKVYGPYTRPDGRQHVIHYDTENKSRRTQSYPRYVKEQELDRTLHSEEFVDHIDGDVTNNDATNFQILTREENNEKSIIENNRQKRLGTYICPACGKEFIRNLSVVRHNQEISGKKGPFCSKQCVGNTYH